jgi:E3 ubiquitin-protein ligase MARCH6
MALTPGDGMGERIFAIALGYAMIGIVITFFLNIFTVRAVKSAMRKQSLVVKASSLSDIHFPQAEVPLR